MDTKGAIDFLLTKETTGLGAFSSELAAILVAKASPKYGLGEFWDEFGHFEDRFAPVFQVAEI